MIQNNSNSSGGTGTRGLNAGGNSPTLKNEIEYISISTLGNSQDFGNLVSASTGRPGAVRQQYEVYLQMEVTPGSSRMTIDFVTISSTGNASDFGDAVNICRI